jgi:DNA-binding response OmpR family regulator
MPATVLIADAEEGLLSLMEATLVKGGFRVITSNSGHDALNLARQENPDLILLELGLPDMDGFEFMRHHPYDEETPIIMLAAVAGTDDLVRSLELGADDFITKPFGMRELTLRVQAVLRRAGRATSHVEAERSIETVPGLDYRFAVA